LLAEFFGRRPYERRKLWFRSECRHGRRAGSVIADTLQHRNAGRRRHAVVFFSTLGHDSMQQLQRHMQVPTLAMVRTIDAVVPVLARRRSSARRRNTITRVCFVGSHLDAAR
jgi:hypothetical protein